MIDKIKNDVFKMKNFVYRFKINNIRNKSEYVVGRVSEIYDRIFIVKSDDGIMHSFSYSDVLTGNVEIGDKLC